jgi:N-terminal acetyltransferase B complex catalytic subunit
MIASFKIPTVCTLLRNVSHKTIRAHRHPSLQCSKRRLVDSDGKSRLHLSFGVSLGFSKNYRLMNQYHNGYYSSYAAQWPEFCMTAESAHEAGPSIKAYSMCLFPVLLSKAEKTVIAKHEPPPPNPQHHAHLTAMSITPSYRSLGLARLFMDHLEVLASNGQDSTPSLLDDKGAEETTEERKGRQDCVDAWFTDLFVRCNNHRAVEMYEKLGYSVYRRVVE